MAYRINAKCDNWGKCLQICPLEAIFAGEVKPQINPELCSDCGTCADICPGRAIKGEEEF